MNILIPDSWLREYLKTKASPEQVREYVSLCGPSVERVQSLGKEVVYDVEVTSNRPDVMSVSGFAREAAAILPRFGFPAKFVNDPYAATHTKPAYRGSKNLRIKTDTELNPRFTAVVLQNVRNESSPPWLKSRLEATGIRPINIVVDVTNYLMRSFGQPAHAFDYDRIGTERGEPTMILRAARPGERLTTLDGKTHTLPGGDIVIEDGNGRLIDLCGIMGAENSRVTKDTKTVLLFMQTYNPVRIRRTSMGLAHRTEAAVLFEKGVDSELVLPTVVAGVELLIKLTGCSVASRLYDLYPKPFRPYRVEVRKKKITAYLSHRLTESEIRKMLSPLGFTVTPKADTLHVRIPSFRRDVTIDVDVIEEIVRIYGYHAIASQLPSGSLTKSIIDPVLVAEENIRVRMRDWGFTETYTYSMISEELLVRFGFDPKHTYRLDNPLTNDWVYMRPSLLPSILTVIRHNSSIRSSLRLFELSMVYRYRKGDLPDEAPMLAVALTGEHFAEAKGIAEAIFGIYGIPFPYERMKQQTRGLIYHPDRSFSLYPYGTVGEIDPAHGARFGLSKPVTVIELDIRALVSSAQSVFAYRPIAKHPPSYEDLAFIVPQNSPIGPIMHALKSVDPVVSDLQLLDSYADSRTFHVTYQHPTRNLTGSDLAGIRKKLIAKAAKLGVIFKS